MKYVLSATLALLLLNACTGDSSAEQRLYNALNFGQSSNDYNYIMFREDMRPFQTALTVCAWIRSLGSADYPTWFSYSTSGQGKEIQITDNGYDFRLFSDSLDLRSIYTVPQETWFHNCLAWDSASQTRDLYINGVLVSSKATPAGRTLEQDGTIVLGNEQDSPGSGMDNNNQFGGEIYNLNVFSKKLNQSEVQEMARNMCLEVEERHGDARVIQWDDVILKTRTGTVTEIDSGTGCKEKQLLDKLQQTEERLNGTLKELERIKEEKETCRNNLENKTAELNTTRLELAQTMTDLDDKEKQLNTTETQKRATVKELEKTTEKLNSTTAALNQTQIELKHVKKSLEKAANVTLDCSRNLKVTSYWDLLYSDEFFGGIVTKEKLELLYKSVKKLGNLIAYFHTSIYYLLIYKLLFKILI